MCNLQEWSVYVWSPGGAGAPHRASGSITWLMRARRWRAATCGVLPRSESPPEFDQIVHTQCHAWTRVDVSRAPGGLARGVAAATHISRCGAASRRRNAPAEPARWTSVPAVLGSNMEGGAEVHDRHGHPLAGASCRAGFGVAGAAGFSEQQHPPWSASAPSPHAPRVVAALRSAQGIHTQVRLSVPAPHREPMSPRMMARTRAMYPVYRLLRGEMHPG